MRRYGLLLMVLVLATASLLAAAAYNTAVVTNAASMTVVETDDALLALTPGTDGDQTARIINGQLVINFDRGMVGAYPTVLGNRGLQPNSVYTWNDLFTVRGRSNNVLKYKIDLFNADGTAVSTSEYQISIWTDRGIGGEVCHVNNNSNTGTFRFESDPYFNKHIDVEITVSPTATVPASLQNLKIVVTATRQ